ncbi:terpene synthase family protein [Streptomyces microflavus]|uniref:terpene synthase family protein n=1 Tax=Streptomyces microflavus TaxID=1919 RepID=UPI0033E172CE
MTFHAPAHVLSGSGYELHEVPCHTRARINPQYPQIYEDNAAWLRTFLPFPDSAAEQRVLECRYPLWDAMVLPDGAARRVLHASCVTSLMFEVDDAALVEHALVADVTGNRVADHPYGAAFADIFGSLRREMPERVYHRYRRSWMDWFASVSQENRFRGTMTAPDLEGYLRVRRTSVGLLPTVVTAEYVLGLDLTEQLAADPDLRRAGVLAVEHAMYVNDLYSFRGESFKGDYFNAVSVLRRAHGLNLQEAVDEIGGRIGEADTALAELSGLLRSRYPDPALHAYLDQVNALCSGNLRWSMETTRYNGRGNTWNGLRSGRVTLHTDRTTISTVT